MSSLFSQLLFSPGRENAASVATHPDLVNIHKQTPCPLESTSTHKILAGSVTILKQNPPGSVNYRGGQSTAEGKSLRNVQWFRGGLVFRSHILHHSTLGSRSIKKKKEEMGGLKKDLLQGAAEEGSNPVLTQSFRAFGVEGSAKP